MRSLCLLGLLLAGVVVDARPASAEVFYPYCLITSGRDGGVWNCGYVSLAQCMASRVGTEMCNINPRTPPVAFAEPRRVRRAPVQ